MKTDLYNHPDHYAMDDLLSEEHKLVRDAARAWVKKEVSPIIDEHYEKATFPMHLLKGLGEIGAFGPYIPEEYGGPGLDFIWLNNARIGEMRLWLAFYCFCSIFFGNVPNLEIWFGRSKTKILKKASERRNDGLLRSYRTRLWL